VFTVHWPNNGVSGSRGKQIYHRLALISEYQCKENWHTKTKSVRINCGLHYPALWDIGAITLPPLNDKSSYAEYSKVLPTGGSFTSNHLDIAVDHMRWLWENEHNMRRVESALHLRAKDGEVFWSDDMPVLFLDIKFGKDSPRFSMTEDVVLEVKRRPANHIDPWTCSRRS